MAATSFMRSWQDFDLVTLVVLPMFLFSTTFYPLSVYPRWLQIVVECLPLFHAVELMRGLTTGVVHAGLLGHLSYFLVMIVVGVVVAARRLDVLLLR
jgi:lipooligosaccharide transport system permease protein